jgi:hypothetical protein
MLQLGATGVLHLVRLLSGRLESVLCRPAQEVVL